MRCTICGDPASMYSGGKGAVLIELCPKHAAQNPSVASIVANSHE